MRGFSKRTLVADALAWVDEHATQRASETDLLEDAAARVLAAHTKLSARRIVEEAMAVAGDLCIYTNDQVTIEEI